MTELGPLGGGPPPPSGPTVLDGMPEDRWVAAWRPKVAAPQAATRGQSRHLVMAGALAGESGRAIARRLALGHKTVQKHLDRLLSKRVLAWNGSRFVAGPAYQFEKARAEGGGPDRYPPGPATAVGGVITDGKRTFTVRGQPGRHPMDMPGFAGTSLSGRGEPSKKRQNHRFKWTADGRTHDMLLTNQPTTGAWGLQYLRCSPAPRKGELGEADKEAVWDRFVSEWACKWAALSEVALDPAPRRSRPVSLAFPGIAPPGIKTRRPNLDIDDTPEPKTVEVRTDELADFIETGPDFKRAVVDNLADLEARYAALEEREDRLVKVASKAADLFEKSQAVQVAILRAVAPPPPSPSLPSFNSGVEFS